MSLRASHSLSLNPYTKQLPDKSCILRQPVANSEWLKLLSAGVPENQLLACLQLSALFNRPDIFPRSNLYQVPRQRRKQIEKFPAQLEKVAAEIQRINSETWFTELRRFCKPRDIDVVMWTSDPGFMKLPKGQRDRNKRIIAAEGERVARLPKLLRLYGGLIRSCIRSYRTAIKVLGQVEPHFRLLVRILLVAQAIRFTGKPQYSSLAKLLTATFIADEQTGKDSGISPESLKFLWKKWHKTWAVTGLRKIRVQGQKVTIFFEVGPEPIVSSRARN